MHMQASQLFFSSIDSGNIINNSSNHWVLSTRNQWFFLRVTVSVAQESQDVQIAPLSKAKQHHTYSRTPV